MNVESTPTTKGHLLIIDDEPELREVLVALLEDVTSEISQAANGIEAIELLKQKKFHAVLSDEKMPKKSGLDVLKWMREHGINTPFIMHTGYGQKDIVREAQKYGAQAFIDKPWDEKTLIRTVQDALNRGMQQDKP
ncbi:response regulator [Bdellovibrio reynosensis]|uniref:Response regulator n=1 Tax=Bdellovibrio reynosensis TaxID=2835041 RepID=A0ABY4CC70_9BACT|nr:response regulator [Bdellovibrio reynosensis]UOF02573.1 response regulator [Bdellovibrio reynosensis]